MGFFDFARRNSDLSPMALRIPLGLILFVHGIRDLGIFGGDGISGMARTYAHFGLLTGTWWAWLFAAIQVFGGVFLLMGTFAYIVPFFVTLMLGIIIFRIDLPNIVSSSSWLRIIFSEGFESHMLMLGASISLMLSGYGRGQVKF